MTEADLQRKRKRPESLGSQMSEADAQECCDAGNEICAQLAEDGQKAVPDAEILIPSMELLRQVLHRLTSSLAELEAPAVAGLTRLLQESVQVAQVLLMPKAENKGPLTGAIEKAAMELFEGTLSAVVAVCNVLPKADDQSRPSLVTCALEAHKATLAFAKAALDSRSQLALRLWKNLGEQLRCAAVDPSLEPVLFDVPAIALHLFDYSAAQLQNALHVWQSPGEQARNEARDKRLTAPIRHGLLTVLRITATCPASVASQPCASSLAALVVVVTSLASGTDCPLPESARGALTKSVAEAMIAVLTMLLESDAVSDESKCFLVRALSDADVTAGRCREKGFTAGGGGSQGPSDGGRTEHGGVALYRACAETDELGALLPAGRLTSFSTLLSQSAKYSLAVKEELSRQLPQVSKLVAGSYPSLLSEMPDSYSQLLQSLATFAVVSETSGSSVARCGTEKFLLEAVVSGHILTQQLAHDLWGFVFQLSDPPRREAQLRTLLTVLAGLVVSEAALTSAGDSSRFLETRGLARAVSSVATLVNQLLRAAAPEQLDAVYRQYVGLPRKGLAETRVCETLLRTGFPAEKLSEALRKDLAGGLLSSVLKAAEGQVSQLGTGTATGTEELLLRSRLAILESVVKDPSSERNGSQPLAQAAGQLALHILTSQTNAKNGKVNGTANGTACTGTPAALYAPALRLLIAAQQHVPSGQLWAVLPALLSVFRAAAHSGSAVPPALKPALANFLAALASVAMPQSGPELQALVELYHALLRESYWALAHVALTSFAHFAATSPYTDLWRLVPTDATAGRFEGALAGDSLSDSGQELDGFMRALQKFLERSVGKDFALSSAAERTALSEDGRILAERTGAALAVRAAGLLDVDLNEPAPEQAHGNGVEVRGEVRQERESNDAGGGAGVPEELQDACDDMDRCVTELRKGLKRAAARLTADERGALRKKFGSLGQKLAGLVDQLFPD